jgi:hypothetical protein
MQCDRVVTLGYRRVSAAWKYGLAYVVTRTATADREHFMESSKSGLVRVYRRPTE